MMREHKKSVWAGIRVYLGGLDHVWVNECGCSQCVEKAHSIYKHVDSMQTRIGTMQLVKNIKS